jgi:hypothetical protein
MLNTLVKDVPRGQLQADEVGQQGGLFFIWQVGRVVVVTVVVVTVVVVVVVRVVVELVEVYLHSVL